MSDLNKNRPHKTYVWDISLRLFHWLLVLGIASQFFTMNVGEGSYTKWHFQVGFCILGLIVYRIIWGFIGSETAQFSQFIRSPKVVIEYLKSAASSQYKFHVGHNPLGALSVIALLGTVAVMVTTGLFIGDDIIWYGPLSSTVSSDTSDLLHDIHEIGQKVLIAIIALHLSAILYYRVRKKTNLVQPMLTGEAESPEDTVQPKMRSGVLGVLLLVACVGISFYYFNGKI